MARLVSALALAYMFDERIDEIVVIGLLDLDGARKMALRHLEAFVANICDPQLFSVVSTSSDPASLVKITESVRIREVGQMSCSRDKVERYVAMLQNPSPTLKSVGAFTLLRFTIPGDRYAVYHMGNLRNIGAPRLLQLQAADARVPLEAKFFARIVLQNLEQHHVQSLV